MSFCSKEERQLRDQLWEQIHQQDLEQERIFLHGFDGELDQQNDCKLDQQDDDELDQQDNGELDQEGDGELEQQGDGELEQQDDDQPQCDDQKLSGDIEYDQSNQEQ